MDQGYLNGVIFLDLKKSFDSIDHNILLMKMKLYGLTEHSSKWFRSCLTNRIHVCKVDDVHSKQTSIKYGVPQGSTLGLFLFFIYANDLPNRLTCSTTSMLYPQEANQ